MRLIRTTPNEGNIRQRIAIARAELANLNSQVVQVRAKPDYLGKDGFRQIKRLEEQFSAQQHMYWLRKRACFDLIEVFSEMHQVEPVVFKAQAGLDEADFVDQDI